MTCISVFPKFLRSLAPVELGRRLRLAGADAVDLVIREGFWVRPRHLGEDLPAFLTALQGEGLACRFCTWGVAPDAVDGDDLGRLAEAGIRRFRLGYFRHDPTRGYVEQVRRAREILEGLLPLLDRHDAQAVYQLHHGTLITAPESAALLVEGLPTQRIALMPDTGNQLHEGLCRPERIEQIIGAYWTDLGVKDVACGPGGARAWVPCGEGANDWPAWVAAWRARRRDGLWNLQPFYHEHDAERHLAAITAEIAFLRRHLA